MCFVESSSFGILRINGGVTFCIQTHPVGWVIPCTVNIVKFWVRICLICSPMLVMTTIDARLHCRDHELASSTVDLQHEEIKFDRRLIRPDMDNWQLATGYQVYSSY